MFDLRNLDFDFQMAYTKANEILATTSVIETFPYKIGELIKEQSDIRLCKYSKALNKYGIPIEDFGSESAVIIEYFGANIIFYNDSEPKYRVVYSIGHEFGHHVLDHKMNLKKTDPLYSKQEIEANYFVAQILMPEQIIREAVRRGKTLNNDFIKESFGVSSNAASKRRKTLANYDFEWRKREEKEYDDIILERYMPFIENIAPINKITNYDFDNEYSRQRERENWLDPRERWT
ncbi:MAG: ImmA/IrrE family metallo-endopeptidase [Alphaproteobacteria bacterium]|nr:ImmA/IrrE family metallo-endopeptidase [Alphaproteobacteria bacterium]